MVIGLALAAAECGRAQEPTPVASADIASLTEKDERLRERFRQLLLVLPKRDLAAGWGLAADIGRPAAPLLWKLFDLEVSSVENRLVLLTAAMVAGGLNDDARLFQWLDQSQKKAMLAERTLAAMLVALGPRRTRPVAGFWPKFLGAGKNPEQLLGVAVRLAAARFPGTDESAPSIVDDDPGLAAACAWSSLPVSTAVAQKLWNTRNPLNHAELFWRGAFLGAARARDASAVPQALIERARDVMSLSGEAFAPARGAATWLRAIAGDLRAEGPRLDAYQLRVAVANAPTAELLRAWLPAEPQPRDQSPQRLAVAYALSRPPQDVLADRAIWAANPSIARHVAVALAWQMLGAKGAGVTVDAVPPDSKLPEWSFVRAAAGATIDRSAVEDNKLEDGKLQSALLLFADNRLDRNVLRDLLEETLWRWGSHPQWAVWELERRLVRDVLLAGSDPGGAEYQPSVPPNARYSPSGLDRDDQFFAIAVKAYEFLLRPRAPIPAEHRLPP